MKKIALILAILLILPLASAGIGELEVESTKYDPYPAQPGNEVTIWVNINNQGSSAVSDVYFKFVPYYPFKLNPGETGIGKTGTIHAGQDQLFYYTLRVDEFAKEGTYNIDVVLCLDASCTSWARTFEVPMSVRTGGAPRVEVGLEETDIFHAGKLGVFTLNIVNRGDLDTKFLTVEVMDSDNYEIIGPAEKYIGELESDDFETAEYQIFIEDFIGKKESEKLEVSIKTEYSDENDKEYQDFENIILKVYSSKDLKRMHLAGGSSAYIWIILIIAGGAGYWFYRRYKKKKLKKS
jgi:hypothetical protein